MIFKKRTSSWGFTLTEMMIVVAILGILALISIMSYMQQQYKGNDSKRKADLDRIKIAVEEYEKDNNCYPPSSLMVKCGSDADIAIHPYLNDVPCDPTTRKAYRYEVEASTCPDWYRIYSLLQYLQDLSVIPNIGPAGDQNYNYYTSSNNAPPVIAGETTHIPTGSGAAPPGCTKQYGCINQQCVEIPLDSNCAPTCQPVYDFCFGQCDSAENPAPECV
ncbi:hypothetical protein A2434_01610 [Candidatus Woesebacteria bacterium RIFOXYC1_FULL_41_14]|nr:MAG: hypothetical protein A2434_01610 [Candidatus Woesebacteria bacterium RIFOXYC1_FULL_41_14]